MERQLPLQLLLMQTVLEATPEVSMTFGNTTHNSKPGPSTDTPQGTDSTLSLRPMVCSEAGAAISLLLTHKHVRSMQ